MSVNPKREEFRQYLEDSGVIKALSTVLMRLFELKYNRPNSAIAFIQEHLSDGTPSSTEYENLRKELEETKALLLGLKNKFQLTDSQLEMANGNNINCISASKQNRFQSGELMSARQSQIMSADRSGTPSFIRGMSKNDVNYSESVRKAITKLLGDAHCNSLSKKYLSMELFDKLENIKTSFGSNLVDCIRSGLEIHDSLIGAYAVDAEAYDVFADLFDPIIEDYHIGFNKEMIHPEPDWGDASLFPDLDPEKAFITSTRLRCVRTVDSFPFVPVMTKENFSELSNKLKEVLINLTGEFSGTWYGLDDIDPETKRDMINNRYILEYGDRFLEAAGATEFWPTGRGVFMNEAKTFFVWVNEEDHLRIICMDAGCNIGSIYGRLINVMDQCSQKLTFSRHKRFGYLTLCPTNLGTTIRASCMVKVPKLAAQGKLEALTNQLNLQIRGGNSDESATRFEISNKRKLGLTEFETMKEMYDGIAAIIQAEKSL